MNLFLEVPNFFPSVSDLLPPLWIHGFIDGFMDSHGFIVGTVRVRSRGKEAVSSFCVETNQFKLP